MRFGLLAFSAVSALCSVALAQNCDLSSPASDASYTETGFDNATVTDPKVMAT